MRSRWIRIFCRGIDTINMWIGEWAGLLLIALMCLVTMEVVLRYIFHSPTLWVWDVNMQLLGAAAAET